MQQEEQMPLKEHQQDMLLWSQLHKANKGLSSSSFFNVRVVRNGCWPVWAAMLGRFSEAVALSDKKRSNSVEKVCVKFKDRQINS